MLLVLSVLLAGCGDNQQVPAADEPPPAADGALDCLGGFGAGEGSDPAAPGFPSAEAAIRSILEPYRERDGGEIVLVVEDRGSLVVEQREVATVLVFLVSEGEWAVARFAACEPFID